MATGATTKDRLRAILPDLLRRSRNDPTLFNDAILGRPPLHRLQREWCRAIVDYRATAIETGNALGKDWLVGCLVPWWLYTRPYSLVIVTGPSQTLLGSVTWGEIRRAIAGSPVFKAKLLPAKVSTGVKTSPQFLEVKPDWHALGFSTTTIERLSGQHRGQLLVIVEEASGVEDYVWEALDGLKYTKLLAIGNPLQAVCGFAALCDLGEQDARNGTPPRRAVKYINTPSTASPHANLDHSPYGLADKGWIEDMARKHGRDSLWFRGHVLAIRPKLSHEVLFHPEWLARATGDAAARAAAEWRKPRGFDSKNEAGKRVVACDVAGGSGAARTVILVRDDVGILEIVASQNIGIDQAASLFIQAANRWGVPTHRTSYDAGGDVGKRFGKALEGKGWIGAVPFFGGGKGSKRYGNARTICAAYAARRMDPESYIGGEKNNRLFHLPNSEHLPRLIEELGQLRGQLKGDVYHLEDKEDLALRLGRSPDYADAFAQSFRWDAYQK